MDCGRRQFREDASPLAHPVQPDHYIAIDNFYTATIYNKGAEVIRMMATIIGRENFRRGMDLYFARHDNQAVTIDDFVQAMQDASGIDLARFKLWYHQAGTPEVTVSDAYDAAARRYTLTLTPTHAADTRTTGQTAVGHPGRDGTAGRQRARIGRRSTLLFGEAAQEFTFEDIEAPPVPSLLRGFSAPVKLSGVPLDATCGSSPRMTPIHSCAGSRDSNTPRTCCWRWSAHGGTERTPTLDQGLIDAIAATLRDADADPAFAAEALTLPSEAFLADQMAIADVDAHPCGTQHRTRDNRPGAARRIARNI